MCDFKQGNIHEDLSVFEFKAVFTYFKLILKHNQNIRTLLNFRIFCFFLS